MKDSDFNIALKSPSELSAAEPFLSRQYGFIASVFFACAMIFLFPQHAEAQPFTGNTDVCTVGPDTDGDGLRDSCDPDDDGDGTPDTAECLNPEIVRLNASVIPLGSGARNVTGSVDISSLASLPAGSIEWNYANAHTSSSGALTVASGDPTTHTFTSTVDHFIRFLHGANLISSGTWDGFRSNEDAAYEWIGTLEAGYAQASTATDYIAYGTGTGGDGTNTGGFRWQSLSPSNYIQVRSTNTVLYNNNYTLSLIVCPEEIAPGDDSGAGSAGTASTPITNVVTNDTVNGGAAADLDTTAGNATVAEVGAWPAGFTLNDDGSVDMDTTVGPGTYEMDYELCDLATPTPNCAIATVTVLVDASHLDQVAETLSSVLSEDRANIILQQSNRISSFSADAVSRLQSRSHNQCLAQVNARLQVENILFDVDRAIIKPESDRTLDEIAAILMGCPGSAFEIAGHTDSDASDAHNIDLSQRRVEAVRRALSARGVDTTGYVARGYGESVPIASNATEAGKARNRRVEFRPLDTAAGYQGPCENSFRLEKKLDASVTDPVVSADGMFVMDQHDCITDRREVFEGTLSYLDTDSGQTQSAISLSYRREKYRGSERVFGYFVGLYGSQSDVTTLATGDISGVGLNAGIYGAKRLQSELFVDYYLGAAVGRHTFDLAFAETYGTIDTTGDYQYLAGFAGVALSGQLELVDTTLAPRIGIDYVTSPAADVDVIADFGDLSEIGSLELDAVSGGRLFAEIRADRSIWDGDANVWISPRLACYQSIGALDGVCGAGGSIGFESTNEGGAFSYGVELTGEWGEGYTQGSLSASASRNIGQGTVRGDVGVARNGASTLGAQYELRF